MNERLTFISLFDEENIKKIKENIKEVDTSLCKIPYGKKVNDRLLADTLPYHFTLFSCSIKKKREIKEALKNFQFAPFQIEVTKVEVINGAEDSFELRFCIKKNEVLYSLQNFMYERFLVAHYNPNTFHFHITIHCDKDKKKIEKIEKIIKESFTPFTLEVKQFGLFEIWSPKLIEKIESVLK